MPSTGGDFQKVAVVDGDDDATIPSAEEDPDSQKVTVTAELQKKVIIDASEVDEAMGKNGTLQETSSSFTFQQQQNPSTSTSTRCWERPVTLSARLPTSSSIHRRRETPLPAEVALLEAVGFVLFLCWQRIIKMM
jgi:hypothetical protein